MLIQSSLLCSVEAGLCYVSAHGKEDVLCDRMPSGETWQVCLKCNKHPLDWHREAKLMEEDRRNAEDPYGSNCESNLVRPSATSTMTENTALNMVYRRKKLRKGSIAPVLNLGPMNVQTSANSPSVISSSAHLSSAEDQPAGSQVDREIEMVKDPVVPSVLCDGVAKINMENDVGMDSLNDSCSSSKSNMERVSDSIETEMDEIGECSSSSVIVMDVTREEMTENDFCINFLRSYGLLGGASLADNVASVGNVITTDGSCCSRSCKTCGHLDSSLNMLLCDHCEEAYHPSCYYPRLKKLPIDEWFCHSCLKRKQKILKETIIRRSPTASVKIELNPLLFMLRDSEPYTTGVRVGKGFQADIPDWSGPIRSDEDDLPEPLEIDPSEYSSLQEENPRKTIRIGSIGNWLQCREVMDRASGIICGKWRRAPLFEIQTDDWECFCAIHWDPSHADCAVPQELETDQILKQLKYIEMLRPRLTAKQQNSDGTNGD